MVLIETNHENLLLALPPIVLAVTGGPESIETRTDIYTIKKTPVADVIADIKSVAANVP